MTMVSRLIEQWVKFLHGFFSEEQVEELMPLARKWARKKRPPPVFGTLAATEEADRASFAGKRGRRKGGGRKRSLTPDQIALGREFFRRALVADQTLRKGRDRAVKLVRRTLKLSDDDVGDDLILRDIIRPELHLK